MSGNKKVKEKKHTFFKKIRHHKNKTKKFKLGSFFNNFTIGKKYGIVFGFIIILFLFSSLFTGHSLKNVINSSSKVEEKSDGSIDIMEMASIFKQKYIIISDILTEQNPTTTADDYLLQGDNFNQLAKQVGEKLTTPEGQKIHEKILTYNDQIDDLFENDI